PAWPASAAVPGTPRPGPPPGTPPAAHTPRQQRERAEGPFGLLEQRQQAPEPQQAQPEQSIADRAGSSQATPQPDQRRPDSDREQPSADWLPQRRRPRHALERPAQQVREAVRVGAHILRDEVRRVEVQPP